MLSNYGSISKIQRKNHYLQIQNSEIGRKNHYFHFELGRKNHSREKLKNVLVRKPGRKSCYFSPILC